MPIREEVPKSPGRQVVSAQSLKDLATLAFEAGALAVGQSGAAIKDSRSVPLQSYPMLGRASNLVRATTEGDFGPIEVFGEQTPFPGSKQVHGELPFPGLNQNWIQTEDVNLLDADSAHLYQSIGGWSSNSNAVVTHETASDAAYGKALGVEVSASGDAQAGLLADTGAPCTPAADYSASFRVRGATISTDTAVAPRILWFDAGGAYLSASPIGSFTAIDDIATWHTVTYGPVTAPASAAFAGLVVLVTDGTAPGGNAGDKVLVEQCFVREGSDPTFVPSLRVLGNLTMQVGFIPKTWPTTSTQKLIDNLGANTGYRLEVRTTPGFNSAHGDGSTIRGSQTNLPVLEVGTFSIVTAEVDGAAGVTTYFQDGVEIDTKSITAGAAVPSGNALRLGASLAGNLTFNGSMVFILVRDGIGTTAPVVAAFDAFDLYGMNLYDGLTFVDGFTGRTWTVHGDDWAASIDVVEDDLDNEFGGFDDYQAAVEVDDTHTQYFETPNVNILDADTAHIQQSVGWIAQAACAVAQTQSWSVFGTSSLEMTATGAAAVEVAQAYFPVDPSTEYTLAATIRNDSGKAMECQAIIDSYSAVPGYLSSVVGTYTEVPDGEAVVISAAGASHASATQVRVRFRWRQLDDSNPVNGDVMLLDAAVLRLGADPTFVPSFNLITAADIRMSLIDNDPGGTEGILAGVFSAQLASRMWQFRRGAANAWQWDVGDGSTTLWGSSNDFAAIAAGRIYLKAIWDGTNRNCYTTDDPADYGTPNVQALDTTLLANPLGFPLMIAACYSSSFKEPGQYFDFELRDGEDGPLVLRFDAANIKEVGDLPAGFSFVGEDGRVWTTPNGASMKWSLKP